MDLLLENRLILKSKGENIEDIGPSLAEEVMRAYINATRDWRN